MSRTSFTDFSFKAGLFSLYASCFFIPLATSLQSISTSAMVLFWLLSGEVKKFPALMRKHRILWPPILLLAMFAIAIFYSIGSWDDRLDFFNVLGDTIFYAKSDKTHPALIRMKTDGSSVEEVKSGVFKMINMTSSYTYFCEYGNTTPMYMTPTYGSISVTTFDAAESAAAQHISKK